MADEAEKAKRQEAAAKRVRMISNQWKTFSKTAAFKELMEYIDMQDEMALMGAKGPVMPFEGKDGEEVIYDLQKSALLLQRSVGYDIVKSYVEGYVNIP